MERTPRARFEYTVGAVASSSRFPNRQRRSQQQPYIEEEDLNIRELFVEEEDLNIRELFVEEEEEHNAQCQGHAHRNSGPVAVTLNDPEVLDCPICYEALTIPVFQCGNGHIVCSRCFLGLMNKCHSCRLPIDHLRSTAMEKVLESVQVTCENAKYGCKETMSYSQKYDHGKACYHAPFCCPITACNFVGSFNQIYQHFRGVHKHAAEEFVYDKVLRITLNVLHDLIFLQEKEGDLFILNNSTETHGYRISINCIAPSCKGGVDYSIVAKSGETAYKFNSCTKSIQKWDENNPPSVVSLLMPSDFFGLDGELNLRICIQRSRLFC